MRSLKTLVIAAAIMGLASSAYAELQNVLVGGNIRIRYNFFNFTGEENDDGFAEQRTRLNVRADFTDEVSAFIEFDSYDIFGEDFRSRYITGADFRAASGDDVEVYQSYIEANEMWGTPLRLRVGRQELAFGSQWLVGVNDASSLFQGLSFDAARVDYIADAFTVTAFGAKLNETFGDFFEDDADFWGVYGSYTGLEDIEIDAYWLYVRDDQSLTAFDTDLHTLGLRGAGTVGGFDFEAEVAYQLGEAELENGIFGDEDLDYDAFGANLALGYTFDVSWTPRLGVGFAFFEGGDNEDGGIFGGDDDELAFNRLFSNWEYTEFFANTDESNLFYYNANVSVAPTESLELTLLGSYFQADEEAERNGLFGNDEADDELGWEVALYADYHYSEDLVFRAGYAHFFGDDGLQDGNLVVGNGLLPVVDSDEDADFDYVFTETEISF